MEIASYSEQLAVRPTTQLLEADWYELARGRLAVRGVRSCHIDLQGLRNFVGRACAEYIRRAYSVVLRFGICRPHGGNAGRRDGRWKSSLLRRRLRSRDGFGRRVSPLGTYETRHLLNGLVGLFGLFVTWRLACSVASGRAGLLALALLATTPAYYGHMFINPKDIPFAAALTALLLLYCMALEEWPRPK